MNRRDIAVKCLEVHTCKDLELYWTDSLQWSLHNGLLVFAGSDSLYDWWFYNLKLYSKQSLTGPGFVHAGFLDLAVGTWKEIKSTVLGRGQILGVAGYSLGAAVACLVAEKLRNVGVTLFACPPIGDKQWAQRYPNKVFRYNCSPDLITRNWFGRTWPTGGDLIQIIGSGNPIQNHIKTLENYIKYWEE
jgi:hypothetical protein